MDSPLHRELEVVTALGADRSAVVEKTSAARLLVVLGRRARRLVPNRSVRLSLEPALEGFVRNVVEYFQASGRLDEYVLTNILTALATADNRGRGVAGVEDYSTLIRRPNPLDPDMDRCFLVGRAGRIGDPGCPLQHLESHGEGLADLPPQMLHVYLAYYHARSSDITRGAPCIPIPDLASLIPDEIRRDPRLEEAFLDVCFSDGAWELYQHRLAA